jgi:hypothetical protein
MSWFLVITPGWHSLFFFLLSEWGLPFQAILKHNSTFKSELPWDEIPYLIFNQNNSETETRGGPRRVK